MFSILVAKSVQFELVILYLGSLQAWLDECTGNIVRAMGPYVVVTHSDTNLLQVII